MTTLDNYTPDYVPAIVPIVEPYHNVPQNPDLWDRAKTAVVRRGNGYDGLGADGDSMAAEPGFNSWHGRQRELIYRDQPLESQYVPCIMEQAGLDWRIIPVPIGASFGTLGFYRVPGMALVRSDSRAVLGVVSEDYSPLQPSALVESAVGMADALKSRVLAAGSFAGGRDTWALVKGIDGGNLPMGAGSINYLLHSANDGSGAFSLTPTHTLVCCQNTLAIALRGAEQVRLRHIGPIADRVEILCQSASVSMDRALLVLRAIEESDILTDLRDDELAAYTSWLVRGNCEPSRDYLVAAQNWTTTDSPNGGRRSSVARVVQCATYVGSHGARSTVRSNIIGSGRAAINLAIGKLIGFDASAGKASVAEFRQALGAV